MSKEIILKSLNLKKFKGVEKLEIVFDKITNIYGENGTGKTTVADAFMWLLFDKDTKERVVGDKESNFQIKTYDSNGEIKHGLDHEVTGVLEVDGKDITLSKVYREKWTKKRGEAEKQLTNHETIYSINEVPVKQKDYKEFINNLIDENLFKLMSNPLYFSINMKWPDRRNLLLDSIGDITVDKIINSRVDLEPLREFLEDKDIDTLRESIKARKRKLNEKIKAIPIRIDEANNSIKELDFDALEFRKRGLVSGIKSIENQLIDTSKINEETLKEKDNLYKLKSALKDIEYTAKVESEKPLDELKNELNTSKNELNYKIEPNILTLENSIKHNNSLINENEKDLESLRNEWNEVNQETLDIDPNNFICPTCKRELEEHDIEDKKAVMHENFNQSKAKRLKTINEKGMKIKETNEKLKLQVEADKQKLSSLYEELEAKKKYVKDLEFKTFNFEPKLNLETNQEYQDILTQIQQLETKLQQPSQSNNEVSELKEKKSNLESELEELNKQLPYKEYNENLKLRITELQNEERELSQKFATLEGQEYLCEEFIKAKVEMLESSINSKFKYVSFKLFDVQVNGAINETCEALINGVTFSNANTASQINAGLDIINALSKHYGVQAPIFIDNRESVNQLIETDSQIINLIVSKDKKLKVEVM